MYPLDFFLFEENNVKVSVVFNDFVLEKLHYRLHVNSDINKKLRNGMPLEILSDWIKQQDFYNKFLEL